MLQMGYAMGAAFNNNNPGLAWSMCQLVNKINEGNQNYTPYEIPEEYR